MTKKGGLRAKCGGLFSQKTVFLERKSEDTFNASNQAEVVAMIDKIIMLLLAFSIAVIALYFNRLL